MVARRPFRSLCGVVALSIVLAGCAPARPAGFFVAAERPTVMLTALIEGELVKTDSGDCWALDHAGGPMALVFPIGSTADVANETVDIPSVGELRIGDRISGGGGSFSPADTGIDGIESCGTAEVAVLNPFD